MSNETSEKKKLKSVSQPEFNVKKEEKSNLQCIIQPRNKQSEQKKKFCFITPNAHVYE